MTNSVSSTAKIYLYQILEILYDFCISCLKLCRTKYAAQKGDPLMCQIFGSKARY